MKLEEIIHMWPPNIHRYEQKFLGVPVISFMGGGFMAVLTFVIFSQAVGGGAGMILGVLGAVIVMGLSMLSMSKLAAFHDMILPRYLMIRWQARRDNTPLQLALIVSTDSHEQIEIMNWEGEIEGVVE
jgi:hypothetical protein